MQLRAGLANATARGHPLFDVVDSIVPLTAVFARYYAAGESRCVFGADGAAGLP